MFDVGRSSFDMFDVGRSFFSMFDVGRSSFFYIVGSEPDRSRLILSL